MNVDDVPAYEGKDPYIFISYSRKNQNIVYPILKGLTDKDNRFRVWFDKNGIRAGEKYLAVIEERATNCACVIFFESSASVNAGGV